MAFKILTHHAIDVTANQYAAQKIIFFPGSNQFYLGNNNDTVIYRINKTGFNVFALPDSDVGGNPPVNILALEDLGGGSGMLYVASNAPLILYKYDTDNEVLTQLQDTFPGENFLWDGVLDPTRRLGFFTGQFKTFKVDLDTGEIFETLNKPNGQPAGANGVPIGTIVGNFNGVGVPGYNVINLITNENEHDNFYGFLYEVDTTGVFQPFSSPTSVKAVSDEDGIPQNGTSDPLKAMEIDLINGFLYILEADNDGMTGNNRTWIAKYSTDFNTHSFVQIPIVGGGPAGGNNPVCMHFDPTNGFVYVGSFSNLSNDRGGVVNRVKISDLTCQDGVVLGATVIYTLILDNAANKLYAFDIPEADGKLRISELDVSVSGAIPLFLNFVEKDDFVSSPGNFGINFPNASAIDVPNDSIYVLGIGEGNVNGITSFDLNPSITRTGFFATNPAALTNGLFDSSAATFIVGGMGYLQQIQVPDFDLLNERTDFGVDMYVAGVNGPSFVCWTMSDTDPRVFYKMGTGDFVSTDSLSIPTTDVTENNIDFQRNKFLFVSDIPRGFHCIISQGDTDNPAQILRVDTANPFGPASTFLVKLLPNYRRVWAVVYDQPNGFFYMSVQFWTGSNFENHILKVSINPLVTLGDIKVTGISPVDKPLTSASIDLVHKLAFFGSTADSIPAAEQILRIDLPDFKQIAVKDAELQYGLYDTLTDPASSKVYFIGEMTGNSGYAISLYTLDNVAIVPAAPTDLHITSGTNTQLNFAWTNNAMNADDIRVEQSLDGVSGWVEIDQLSPSTTSFGASGLDPATLYYFRVRASNVNGFGDYSNIEGGTTEQDPVFGFQFTRLGDIGLCDFNFGSMVVGVPPLAYITAYNNNTNHVLLREVSLDTLSLKRERDIGGGNPGLIQLDIANDVLYFLGNANLFRFVLSTFADIDSNGVGGNLGGGLTLDLTNGFAFYMNNANAIVKVQLSDLSVVDTLAISPFNPPYYGHAFFDLAAGFGYITGITAGDTPPFITTVRKFTLSPLAFVDIKTHTDPAVTFGSAFLDVDNQVIYLGSQFSPPAVNELLTFDLTTFDFLPGPYESDPDTEEITGMITENGFLYAGSLMFSDQSFRMLQFMRSPFAFTGFITFPTGPTGDINGSASELTQAATTGGKVYYPAIGNSGTRLFLMEFNSGGVISPPADPTDLFAFATGQTTVTLNWTDNASDEDGFKIERSLNNMAWTEIDQVGADVQTYNATGLSSATKYYFRVRAFSTSGGNSGYTNVAFTRTFGQDQPFTFIERVDLSALGISGSSSQEDVLVGATLPFFIIMDPQGGSPFFKVDTLNLGSSAALSLTGQGIAINIAGGKLYTGDTDQQFRVFNYPALDGEVDYPTANQMVFMVYDNTRSRAYITNGQIVSRIDPTNGNEDAFVDFGSSDVTNYQGSSLLLDEERGYVYLICGINTGSKAAVARVRLSDFSDQGVVVITALPGGAPYGRAIDTDRGYIYVTGRGTLYKISLQDFILVDSLDFVSPNISFNSAVTIDIRNGFAYLVTTKGVPTPPPGRISKIDLSTFTEVAFEEKDDDLGSTLGAGLTPINGFGVFAVQDSPGTAFGYKYKLMTAPPSAPTTLVATPVSASRIDLSWTDTSSDEDGFKIEQSLNNMDWAEIDQVAANVHDYASIGLSPSTLYYYRVRAFNAGGDSAYTNVASATTLSGSTIPTAPTMLVATTISSSIVQLDWQDNSSNEDGFKVESSFDGLNFTEIEILDPDTETAVISALSPGTNYWFRIRAFNGSGNSAYTNLAMTATQFPPADSIVRVFDPIDQVRELPQDQVRGIYDVREVMRDASAKLLSNRRDQIQSDFLVYMNGLEGRLAAGVTSSGVFLSPSLVSFILQERDRAVSYYNLDTDVGNYEAGIILSALVGLLE